MMKVLVVDLSNVSGPTSGVVIGAVLLLLDTDNSPNILLYWLLTAAAPNCFIKNFLCPLFLELQTEFIIMLPVFSRGLEVQKLE